MTTTNTLIPASELPAEASEPSAGRCAVSSGSASGGPRLRWRVCSRNHYEGDYRKHTVEVWRDSPRKPWHFIVTGPDGIRAADGQMRECTTQREAIIYAVRGAMLWPNNCGLPPEGRRAP